MYLRLKKSVVFWSVHFYYVHVFSQWNVSTWHQNKCIRNFEWLKFRITVGSRWGHTRGGSRQMRARACFPAPQHWLVLRKNSPQDLETSGCPSLPATIFSVALGHTQVHLGRGAGFLTLWILGRPLHCFILGFNPWKPFFTKRWWNKPSLRNGACGASSSPDSGLGPVTVADGPGQLSFWPVCFTGLPLCHCSNQLAWRDVQHLLVKTSRPAHLKANDWKVNGAGHKGAVAGPVGLGGDRSARPGGPTGVTWWNLY